ncbi:MAG: DUF2254 domain-containing protein [Rhodospirillaceae bacterium]|nr:DUF2254 domain-containing protein [Rhodospirillaceae bacterium]
MNARLRFLLFNMINSFWFLPAILVAGVVASAVGTVALDRLVGRQWASRAPWLFQISADSARDILSTIAGSMIAATSLVFSMTLVALTLASSQLGPRLLAMFRADRLTQVMLGVFIATLVYAQILLRLTTSSAEGYDAFVPLISVSVVQLLTVVSICTLVYFIHHLANLVQTDTMVSHVGARLDDTIRQMFPDEPVDAGRNGEPALPPSFDKFAVPLPAVEAGYVQTMDRDRLVRAATDADVVIDVLVHPGHFVLGGADMARIWPQDRCTDAVKAQVAGCIVLGRKRTQAEDLDFSIKALVEVALRALSPGVSDPFTALACIDRIAASLSLAMGRGEPPACGRDEAGDLRVVWPEMGFVALLNAGFDEIRRAAKTNLTVAERIVAMLARLAVGAADPRYRTAIRRQGDLTIAQARETFPLAQDREGFERTADQLAGALRRWGDADD